MMTATEFLVLATIAIIWYAYMQTDFVEGGEFSDFSKFFWRGIMSTIILIGLVSYYFLRTG